MLIKRRVGRIKMSGNCNMRIDLFIAIIIDFTLGERRRGEGTMPHREGIP